jgi:hypothetical protein
MKPLHLLAALPILLVACAENKAPETPTAGTPNNNFDSSVLTEPGPGLGGNTKTVGGGATSSGLTPAPLPGSPGGSPTIPQLTPTPGTPGLAPNPTVPLPAPNTTPPVPSPNSPNVPAPGSPSNPSLGPSTPGAPPTLPSPGVYH